VNDKMLSSKNLKDGWYLDHTAELDHPDLLKDKAGVPYIDYANVGKHYNPWFVSQMALAHLTRYSKCGLPSDLSAFKTACDWLVENAHAHSRGLTWYYHFDWNHGRKAPWISALSQGTAVAALLRAGLLFGESKYLWVAERAISLFNVPMQDGGVSHFHHDGTVSFEEVVSHECLERPLSTLNGHLFAAWAVREWAMYSGDSCYEVLTERAHHFLVERIRDYDLGYWSAYNLFRGFGGMPAIASAMYHELHIAQLRVHTRLFPNTALQDALYRFNMYQESRFCRVRATLMKVIFKVCYF
jgi:hypothetical protein